MTLPISKELTHYLSLVTHAFGRMIMGHCLSNDMNAKSVAKAMEMDIENRTTDAILVHHSNRGLQYCLAIYQKLLAQNHIRPSMTDGCDCYKKNALAERVNGILKNEFLIDRCNTGNQFKKLVQESIKTYNNKRPHLPLKMKTPNFIHSKKSCEASFTGFI